MVINSEETTGNHKYCGYKTGLRKDVQCRSGAVVN